MKTKMNILMVLALLAGLVLSSPPQTVIAETSVPYEATFEFTSSPSPLAAYQEVTFTLAATGTHPTYPPFGYVTFSDNGAVISGCDQVYLNYPGSNPTPGYPAKCTTRLTTTGVHDIKAAFQSIVPSWYAHETITLPGGQMVNERLPITITPETLPDGIYGTYYSAVISSTCPGEIACGMLWWGSSTMPPGMELVTTTPASLEGFPSAAGEFTITVGVEDGGPSGAFGSRAYTWTVQKATPRVRIEKLPASSGWIYLLAYVEHPGSYSNLRPGGSVSFSVEGKPLQGCAERPILSGWGYADCNFQVPAGLQPGSHTVQAVFTPDAASAVNYTGASGTWTLDVPVSVSGLLFRDLDRNGVRGVGEEPLAYYDLYLDHHCDGSRDTWSWSDYEGKFVFDNVILGGTYCLGVPQYGASQVTTQLEPFSAAGGEYFEIGLYWTDFIFNPETLPSGGVGEPYYQEITASGGTAPYRYTLQESDLPAGLTLSEEGVLSGTPTQAGAYYITVQAEDAAGQSDDQYYYLRITAEGVFTFISSSNPAAVGEALTFTISASGDVLIPDFGGVPLPPHGEVTFFANDIPIDGCSGLPLNIDFDEYGDIVIGNYPATCTTAALEPGTHLITASFLDYTGFYAAPNLVLTQVVESIPTTAADLSINKTDSKDPIKTGAKLVYTLAVRNSGPDAAQDLILVDTLDRSTTYVSTSAPRGWTCAYSNYKVTCSSASLAAGGSASIKITVTVNKDAKLGKDLVNNAVVSSATYDPDLRNNSVAQKTTVLR